MTIDDTAGQALVSRASILRFESGLVVKPLIRTALQTTYERAGATFTENGVEIQPVRIAP